MSFEAMEVVAKVAMIVVALVIPAYLARRIKHGEARFDTDGKLIEK
ncbi:hypothetical protein CP97_14808 [Aurantiacibacter atlanticus]|uniref:Uncharacterized protein n=1 Tax=Aurantiacibacter atlanticus TaxID=1648404 RepID=A0A161IGH2_9SPHN|nr:hypothetical protein [Aurantiacibacter atlanticus]ANC50494.1 hypothetical protein CP97_14808 [Aurantiacibacter atlanticus]MDF1835448.1 hypothetical protein [Alteraurantiacibacter sp. bin_em_oilr2.035]